MDIKDLYGEMQYKWRVQSFSKVKPQAQCVAYIDARDVMKKLDDVVGQGNWQDEYYIANNMLFCKVGIKIDNEWVWKSDTGSESNIEKEKGHSSDAFKRACVKWGIGRFLYELDIKYLEANEIKTATNFPCVVNNGKKVWDITKLINGGTITTNAGNTYNNPIPSAVKQSSPSAKVVNPVVDLESPAEKMKVYKKTGYKKLVVGDMCEHCGGKIVLNPNSGNTFCENKCWLLENNHLRNKEEKVINVDKQITEQPFGKDVEPPASFLKD